MPSPRSFLPCLFVFAALLATAPVAVAVEPPAPSPALLDSLRLKNARLTPIVISPAAPNSPSLELTLELANAAQPRLATFLLNPYPLRAPGFRVVVVGDDLIEREVSAPAPTAFHGEDAATGDEIWASIANGQVRATIVPARPGSPYIYIQALSDGLSPKAVQEAAVPIADPSIHAVYSSTDILPSKAICGNDDCPECQPRGGGATTPTFTPRGPGTCKYVELIAEADFPYYQSLLNSAANVVQDVEAVLVFVNAAYRNTAGFTPPIRFALKQVTVRASNAADPYNAFAVPPAEVIQNNLLGTVATHWSGVSTTRDHVHLFTGRDLTGATVGVAYTGEMCTNFSYSLAQSRFSNNIVERAQDSAHELGHSLGFAHDGVGGFIMAASITIGSPATTFSSTSVTAYSNGVAGSAYNCLNNAPPDTLPDWAQILAGQQATIDVLANDGQGVICTAPVTTFTLASSTSSLGGTVSVSVGTGPGGRNQVLYTPPASASSGEDVFNYITGGLSVPVYISIVAPRQPDQPYWAVLQNLGAKYYDLQNPNMTVSLFPTIQDFANYPQFGSGVAAQLNYPAGSPSAGGSGRTFAVGCAYEGFIRVPVLGFYQFWLSSNDLSRLYIGNTLVLNGGGVSSTIEGTGIIALAPGRHRLHVDYVQYSGGAAGAQLIMSWAYPGQAKAIVPASALWRAAGTCHADFDASGGAAAVADIFSFLAAWFSSNPRADINGDGLITVADIFAFLTVWFGPC